MDRDKLRLDSIFLEASEKANASERSTYLDSACGSDQELRLRVERLLAAQPKVRDFLELPAAGVTATLDQEIAERPGSLIGPYKLLEQIGEGGFGVVFMAEQTQPVQRKVALKVIKPGMDSKQVMARFEAERQALAMMDHVNIARVFDAGATAAGRPYFVMELVHGVPITKYCDDNHLTPRERLELFVPVCQAIQHAHQKGIIHRDVKPSNVMITLYDGKPVPKVIDFGVAKATEQKLTERTLFTQYGTMVGTLEYMSPEQAEMSALGVDTRSDIFSLGVLLYELLTGSTPLTHKRMKEAAYAEILRMIKEEEPPKPSTRLSDSGEALASISANRHTEPAKLTKLVRGELDWIVMKTLEKDRNRRYETASAFAADVQRYLAEEPVLACPPRAGYRLRKMVRRNRTQIAVAGGLGLAVLTGLLVLAWAGLWRTQQRMAAARAAEVALADADVSQNKGDWPEALLSVRRIEPLLQTGVLDDMLRQQVAERLADLNFVTQLQSIRLRRAIRWDPKTDVFQADSSSYRQAFRDFGIDVTTIAPAEAAEFLRARSVRVELATALDDWANLCRTTGDKGEVSSNALSALARLTDPDDFRNQLRDALQGRDPKALSDFAASPQVVDSPPSTILLLAAALYETGSRARAVAVLRNGQRRHAGDFWLNLQLHNSLRGLPDSPKEDRVRFIAAATAIRPLDPQTHCELAEALLGSGGRADDAVAEYREAIRLRPDYLHAHYGLAHTLLNSGRLDEALAEFRASASLTPPDQLVLRALNHRGIGWVWNAKHEYDQAIAEYRKTILLYEKERDRLLRYPRESRQYAEGTSLNGDIANAQVNIGMSLLSLGQFDKAIAECRRALELDSSEIGARLTIGRALVRERRTDEAIAEFREYVRLCRNDTSLYESLFDLGQALFEMGERDEAVATIRRAIRLRPDHPGDHRLLGNYLVAMGRIDEGIAELREAIRLHKPASSAFFHCDLARAFQSQGQFRRAVEEFRLGHELMPQDSGWKSRSAQWLRDAERMASLDARLPKILTGDDEPANAAERILLVQLCLKPYKQMNSAAARFYVEAFAADPKLAEDLQASHRYDAACVAALAGCGVGKDAGGLDDKERTRLRRQALTWLRADLFHRRKEIEGHDAKRQAAGQRMLNHWLGDADLAGVRDPTGLAKLPEDELRDWEKLWREVEELGKRVSPEGKGR